MVYFLGPNSWLMRLVLLVAIPIGKLGDRLGRRKIMALSLLGVAGSLTEIFVVCGWILFFSIDLSLLFDGLMDGRVFTDRLVRCIPADVSSPASLALICSPPVW